MLFVPLLGLGLFELLLNPVRCQIDAGVNVAAFFLYHEDFLVLRPDDDFYRDIARFFASFFAVNNDLNPVDDVVKFRQLGGFLLGVTFYRFRYISMFAANRE